MTRIDSQEPLGASDEEGSLRSRRGIAALACLLVPGSGHLFLGMNRRALAWFGGSAVLLLLAPFSIWPMLLAHFGARLASAVDAWRCARARGPAPKLGGAFLKAGGLVVLTIVHSMVIRNYVALGFKIPASSMEPTFRIGDHIMTSKLDSTPARGDVAVFVYPCDQRKDFVKRIVGLEGDTVEVRCDQLYVNGKAVEREALSGDCSYWDLDMDHWRAHECVRYRETLDGHRYDVIHEAGRTDTIPEGTEGRHDFPGSQLPSCQDTYDGHNADATGPIGTLIGDKDASSENCATSRSYLVPDGHFFVMGDNRDNSSDSRVWGPVPNTDLVGKVVYIWWSKQRPEDGINWDRFGQRVQ